MLNLNSAIKIAAAFPGLRTPDPVSFEGNVAENWREFERHSTIYRKAALKTCDPDEVAYILLNLAGPEAIEREKTLTHKPEVKGWRTSSDSSRKQRRSRSSNYQIQRAMQPSNKYHR